MATFHDLQPGYYYLIKEHETASIELIFVSMETNKCILIEYQDAEQTMNWYKKTDTIHELIEKLSDEQAMVFENLFDNEEEEDDLDWPEETDDTTDWFSPDFDDTDDEEKRKAMNN
jgi:hypothetical protein